MNSFPPIRVPYSIPSDISLRDAISDLPPVPSIEPFEFSNLPLFRVNWKFNESKLREAFSWLYLALIEDRLDDVIRLYVESFESVRHAYILKKEILFKEFAGKYRRVLQSGNGLPKLNGRQLELLEEIKEEDLLKQTDLYTSFWTEFIDDVSKKVKSVIELSADVYQLKQKLFEIDFSKLMEMANVLLERFVKEYEAEYRRFLSLLEQMDLQFKYFDIIIEIEKTRYERMKKLLEMEDMRNIFRGQANEYIMLYNKYLEELERMKGLSYRYNLVEVERYKMALKRFNAQIEMYQQANRLLSGNMDLYRKQLTIVDKKLDVGRKRRTIFERRLELERELFSGYEESVHAKLEKVLAEIEKYETQLKRFETNLKKAAIEHKARIEDTKASYFDALLSLLNYEKDNFRSLLDAKYAMEKRLLDYNIDSVGFRTQLDTLEHRGKLIYEGSSRMLQRVINYNRAVAMACANITANIIRSSS